MTLSRVIPGRIEVESGGVDQAERGRLLELVLVLPAIRPVGLDDQVELLVERVVADR